MVLDPGETNATATFYRPATDESVGPYEDPEGDWEPEHEDVPVTWDPQSARFESAETGDVMRREDRMFAPLELADIHEAGDRVDVHYRDRILRLRITEGATRSFDGVVGFWQLSVRSEGD